ncbi:MAG: NosD domain-containing protein, partial [Methanosarcina sp.]|nr:NosD domain-containing protein [Methanosarcina sp.]
MWQIKRGLSILFTVALALQAIAGSAAAATIYVDDDGPGNYTTIQAALNDAVDGDTIIVQPGAYPNDERIQVNVSVTIKGASGYPSVGGFNLYMSSRIEALTITKGVDFDRAGTECTIRNNRFEGCGVSMGNNYLYGNQIVMNNLFTGSPAGVSTFDSIDNKITGNTFQNCYIGIAFGYGGGGHVVTGNTFKDCDVGIRITDDSATIYNNYFSNDINLKLESDGNAQLNTSKTADKNIIGGPYIGGNFWGTPSGDGFSQTHLDQNGDGIAEEAYKIDGDVIDYFPLVTPRTEPAPILPIADFSVNITSGSAPLSVLFTDLSQNADSWSWDFDNNGQTDSAVQNPVYVYEVPGTYTVKLTAVNPNGTASKTATITVLEKEEEEVEILPVADFSMNVTSGNAPLSVLFTDLSRDATSRSWDVNNEIG